MVPWLFYWGERRIVWKIMMYDHLRAEHENLIDDRKYLINFILKSITN